MPMTATAETEEKAWELAEHLAWFVRGKSEPQLAQPPGYGTTAAAVAALQGKVVSRTGAVRARGIEYMRDVGPLVCGTPDQVYDQIKAFHDRVGGFGHLLVMQQGGAMGHEDTVASMTLFAREVMPRLEELGVSPEPVAAAAGD
jgi:alkanesulfonate monooxygenase SsuD/methylene tetrahydromethanopterin reductase-like flavin-dependent oxidoreductase (luciferase family)